MPSGHSATIKPGILGLMLLVASAFACGPAVELPPIPREGTPAGGSPVGPGLPAGGLAVWESNRDGSWGIWVQSFDERGPRRLSPLEAGRDHCCAHISPGGRQVAYLSRPTLGDYQERPIDGELRLLLRDGSGERVLGPARGQVWANRSAVWRSEGELILIGADGLTYLHDLPTGRRRALTRVAEPLGWLVDPTLRHATQALPSFSPYDARSRAITSLFGFRGCESYFSADGRWGYWVERGGGPIRRMRLGDRLVSDWIGRDDPRLPKGRRYVYFPMLSRDGGWLAYGASGGGHSHSKANYEIFVVPVDRETLDLTGPPLRLTDHPKVDRYPDLWVPADARP
ncbi:MAG TPA: hypothetical protein VF017_14420 [Thermoanaerobaculia bacterium]|nr:hypothetical protein [Thermoanaerobaculia bacterium]